MVWFSLLLAFDFVGFAVLLAIVAGWSVPNSAYALSALSLFYFGSATLGFHLFRYLVEHLPGPPDVLRLGTRLERSLIRAAAWLALSTYLLIVGTYDMQLYATAVLELWRHLRGMICVMLGAIAVFYSSRLLIRGTR